MKAHRTSAGFLLRLDKGEEAVSSLASFCEKEKIGFASISGIGAASEVVLAVFDTKKKEYLEQKFEGDIEIVSLSGNVTTMDSKPKIHAHACIADHSFGARGGHLVSAEISVTCEIVVSDVGGKVERKKDGETGLMLVG